MLTTRGHTTCWDETIWEHATDVRLVHVDGAVCAWNLALNVAKRLYVMLSAAMLIQPYKVFFCGNLAWLQC